MCTFSHRIEIEIDEYERCCVEYQLYFILSNHTIAEKTATTSKIETVQTHK